MKALIEMFGETLNMENLIFINAYDEKLLTNQKIVCYFNDFIFITQITIGLQNKYTLKINRGKKQYI
jgi:hypothetical protein